MSASASCFGAADWCGPLSLKLCGCEALDQWHVPTSHGSEILFLVLGWVSTQTMDSFLGQRSISSHGDTCLNLLVAVRGTICGGWFSPSITWALGIKLTLPALRFTCWALRPCLIFYFKMNGVTADRFEIIACFSVCKYNISKRMCMSCLVVTTLASSSISLSHYFSRNSREHTRAKPWKTAREEGSVSLPYFVAGV